MTERFQVDMAGLVDVLSRHLYSGPQVFVRELLQNAVDAIAARRALDPAAEATVRIRIVASDEGPVLEVVDTGIGLTADDAAELLSTIGRSSKREPQLGTGREQFIGQFGIGMLAAFMVADRIEVASRSHHGGEPVQWIGRADGTFDLTGLAGDLPVGTKVRLHPRADADHWFDPHTVAGLAADYGSLLPVDVAVAVPVAGAGTLWRRISAAAPPWALAYANESDREAALSSWCRETLGFTPIGHIDLDLPLVGLDGVAFILPQALPPGSGSHRVYVKRMLLGARVDGVLPDWAFFVRAVVDTTALTPTASREQLHADEILLATRDALGTRLKRWAIDTLSEQHPIARAFLRTHHLALRALATTDDDLLDLVSRVLPYETTDGHRTLAEIAARDGELVYTSTTEAYQRVASVARAQGLTVVNAGYVYDTAIVDRLRRRAGWITRELTSNEIYHSLEAAESERTGEHLAALGRAQDLLAERDVDVLIRRYEPETVPALLLRDPEGERRRDLDAERAATPHLWAGLLDAIDEPRTARSRSLVLNERSPVVRLLLQTAEPEVFTAGLHALYLSAVMLAGDGLGTRDITTLNHSLSVLLASAAAAEPA